MSEIGIGVGIGEFDAVAPKQEYTPKYACATVDSIFSATFKSGVALDISKNHTGVCMWRDNQVFVSGFKIDYEYDDTDYMAEAKMRMEFKAKLYSILKDYDWEYCIVEDVYGGNNFDTTRKLLALNCVVDELVLEGNLNIANIYRFKEPEWLKYAKMTSSVDGKLDSKIITQRILNNLGYNFYLANKDLSDGEKEKIFFEDICDATAQLIGLAICIQKNITPAARKKKRLTFSSLVYDYVVEIEELEYSKHKVLRDETLNSRYITYTGGSIEKFMLSNVEKYPDEILMSRIDMTAMGTFAIKHNIDLLLDGTLVFCNKGINKKEK